MITEIAHISILPEKAPQFVAAVSQAAPLFRAADGCHGMRLEEVIETPGQFRLCVDWESVDHHMVTFRQSEAFEQWRALAGPFFLEPPKVEHWNNCGSFF